MEPLPLGGATISTTVSPIDGGSKSTELIFSVLLSEDGARNVRFERALRT
jgi:hypothetical protein